MLVWLQKMSPEELSQNFGSLVLMFGSLSAQRISLEKPHYSKVKLASAVASECVKPYELPK